MLIKRIVALILVLATCLAGLVGCGKANSTGGIGNTKIEIVEDGDSEKGIYFYRDNLKIYGKLFLPEGDGPFPVVIFSSPMGGSLYYARDVIEALNEKGIAGVCFDFTGAVSNSKSEGSLTDYSVLTEAKDLTAVIGGIKSFDRIDTNNIFLWGHSIGGFVTAYVGSEYPDEIKGLILVEPSLQLHDQVREYFKDESEIPDVVTTPFYAGGIYFKDAMSFDIYDKLSSCTENTLIIVGTVAPSIGAEAPEYIDRALELMPNASVTEVEGATHQFDGKARAPMIDLTVEFVAGCI